MGLVPRQGRPLPAPQLAELGLPVGDGLGDVRVRGAQLLQQLNILGQLRNPAADVLRIVLLRRRGVDHGGGRRGKAGGLLGLRKALLESRKARL